MHARPRCVIVATYTLTRRLWHTAQLMATAGSGSSSRLPATIYVFDLVAAGRKLAKTMTARLKPLLQDGRVAKVLHDAARVGGCHRCCMQHAIACTP